MKTVHISGDSQLIIKQLCMIYRCLKPDLTILHRYVTILLNKLNDVTLTYVPRLLNYKANKLAYVASSFGVPKESNDKCIKIERFLPPLHERLTNQGFQIMELNEVDTTEDWRDPIV